MVLDDGWFGHRDDDTSSLGDWYPDLKKLPQGIRGLAEKIENMGMKFGLWIEPEMVNKDSRLYEEHPDWVIRVPYREACHGRNQFVLDFSKEEVVDYIATRFPESSECACIVYQMGHEPKYLGGILAGKKSRGAGKTVPPAYSRRLPLYERLTSEFPEVLFESCASGGARFDPGMLYYAPQCWTSDNTDAVERLRIQYGTSFVYPLSSMGCHVSEAPNQQTFRNTPLSTRAETAYFGCFGYEMDLDTLTEEEKEEVKEQIQYYKRIRKLVMDGTFYRLISRLKETRRRGWSFQKIKGMHWQDITG